MSTKTRRTRSPSAKSDTLTHALSHRQVRLEHILHEELQALLTDEAREPSLGGLVVLAVHLSPDGGHARVAYAVSGALGQEQEVSKASRAGLERATGFLRARLAQQLELKKLPRLSFTFVGIAPDGGEPCLE